MRRALILLGLMMLSTPTRATETVRAIDGDGLRVDGVAIRLWGIDAPELAQRCEIDGRDTPCGEDARKVLGAVLMAGNVVCEEKDSDRYGRIVARCMAGGRDVAAEMVRRGYALDYRRYSGGVYADEERRARKAKRGIWAGTFTPPWKWRQKTGRP